MRTKHFLLAGCLMLAMSGALAQPWDQSGNNITLLTDYLGCDGSSTVPLHLRTIPHLPIHFSTSDTLRVRINPYLPNQTVGKLYTNEDLSGYVGIGEFGTTVVSRPISLLHLDRAGAAVDGWRPWMRTGTLYTVNTDHMYVGTKEENSDRVDAVVAWADNPESISTFGPDALRFIFTQSEVFSTVAGSANGLEIARMIPDTSGNEGYMGIGDYHNTGLQPDERLDVLDRTIRIRRLVPDYENHTLDAVVVTDNTGRLHWRPVSSLVTNDCAWTLQGPPGSNNHIATAYQGNPGCPQEDRGVGIGVTLPKFKLHVAHDFAESNYFGGGIFSEFFATHNPGTAIRGFISPPLGVETINTQPLTAVAGVATDSRTTIGVEGIAFRSPWGPLNVGTVTGVRGEADGHGYAVRSIGVYGKGDGATILSNNWAAYFEGRGWLTSGPWQPCDEQLKLQIADVEEEIGASILSHLHPKTYHYDTETFSYMGLPGELQYGLMAHEVEEVLPDLVMDMVRPAEYDSTGQVVVEELSFKSLNYTGLIPLLIAGHKAQEARIEELATRLDQLEQALAACCAPSDGSLMQQPLDSEGEPKNDPALKRLLRIDPNPFTDATTLRYTLERAGRVQLLVNSSDGKQLQVLHEGLASAGDHSYDWNTGHLAPGIYYVTLLLDGEPRVKRAVKVR